jgi:hypothetical protein
VGTALVTAKPPLVGTLRVFEAHRDPLKPADLAWSRGHQCLNQPLDPANLPSQRRNPGLLEEDGGSTVVVTVEPTRLNANRFASLAGGRMSLDEAD